MAMSPRLLRPRAAGGFTPKTISGLGLWLDATDTSSLTFNGSTVSEWRDLSGNGRHFAQATAASQPTGDNRTQNGRRVLNFDGGDVLLGNSAALGLARNIGALSVFLVYAEDTVVGNRTIFHAAVSASTSVARFSFIPTGTTSRIAARRLDADAAAILGASSTANTIPRVFSVVLNYSSASGDIYFEGASVASSTTLTSAGNTSNTDGGSISVGAQGSAAEPMDGFMGEVIVYRRALTTDERQRVERYLGLKWGIAVA
jgi:hypothetical protein